MSSELEQLIRVGNDITAIRYYIVATGTVLFYDYLLTLSDEIEYVWSEKKSFASWLFIFNRYFPMTYQLWQLGVSYSPQSQLDKEVCNKTAWYPAFSFVVCTLLAQVVLTLRMYAVTMKNIPITVGFSIVTVCQLVLGLCAVVFAAKGGAQTLPPIPLDAYHVCVFVQHRALEITYTGISLFYDFFAFSLTIFFVTRSRKTGLRTSVILKTIAEDAARYFLFIFTSHFVLEAALSFGNEAVQLVSSSASGNVVYLPVMISRLVLSLRKAAYPHQNGRLRTEPSASSRSPHGMRFARPRRVTYPEYPEEDDIALETYREA